MPILDSIATTMNDNGDGANQEVVTAAVKQNALALEHASSILRSNQEIVTAAINQNGLALQHASFRLRSNQEVVIAGVR